MPYDHAEVMGAASFPGSTHTDVLMLDAVSAIQRGDTAAATNMIVNASYADLINKQIPMRQALAVLSPYTYRSHYYKGGAKFISHWAKHFFDGRKKFAEMEELRRDRVSFYCAKLHNTKTKDNTHLGHFKRTIVNSEELKEFADAWLKRKYRYTVDQSALDGISAYFNPKMYIVKKNKICSLETWHEAYQQGKVIFEKFASNKTKNKTAFFFNMSGRMEGEDVINNQDDDQFVLLKINLNSMYDWMIEDTIYRPQWEKCIKDREELLQKVQSSVLTID